MYVIRDKIKYRAKVRTKSQSGNTGFTDGLLYDTIGWCDFVHVIEGIPTSISLLSSNSLITESSRFNLGGKQIKQPQRE